MIKRLSVILLFAAVSVWGVTELPREIGAVREYVAESEEFHISEYDAIMRTVESESGVDWRLLSAIAYTESRFRNDVVSRRGAVGVMQVMPSIGRYFGVDSEAELANPHNNIRVAAFLLCEIENAVKLPAVTPTKDKIGIVLASYNGGIGHVSDARRLARAFGEDMNSWIVVSRYLRLKSDPQYYEHEVVKYGRFRDGRHTTAYVRDVMNRYEYYIRQEERFNAAAAARAEL
ncbi:MAG: transglycosylase SLT domain-containing protein [Alistipes sp.]|nr:transglycosylase SLT domain-containing protein [Alistipes sp.]